MSKHTPAPSNNQGEVDERMVPAKHKGSGIYGEHVARYSAAEDVVRDKVVLDIACGSGYGTRQLATTAKTVVGVDIASEAVTYAKKHYAAPNITYTKGDGKRIPAEDNTFDVVVSFETIEHLDDYHAFMREIKRVLKSDGLFVLSTPNEREFAEGNHFHLHEFEHDELLNLVAEHYTQVKPYYQATWIGNIVGDYAAMTTEWDALTPLKQLRPVTPNEFLYFYFLCSDREISETVTTQAVMSQHWSDRTVIEKNTLTNNHIQNLEAKVDENATDIAQLERSLKQTQHERDKLARELAAVYGSKRWRLISKVASAAKPRKRS